MENPKSVCKFEYYADGDVFYINRNVVDEKTMGSLPIGNFVFDIGASGSIIGLEIDNASKVLGVSADKISNARSARLGAVIKGNILFLFFNIDLGIKNYEFSYAISKSKIPIVA